jgi:hypothetical protein
MRDSSLQGKKTYLSAFGKLPKEEAEEAESLEGKGKLAYAQSRAVGFSHDHSMGVGYTADGIDFDAHREAVESALASGKPVPAHVLADYPDLAAKHKPSKPTTRDLQESTEAKSPRSSLFTELENETKLELQGELFGGEKPRQAATD